MHSFHEIGSRVGTDKIGHGYHVWYEKHFSNLRDRPINLLEIGVWEGFSLKLWEEYFPLGKIYGIDIDAGCARHQSARVNVLIGSQEDPIFLAEVAKNVGELDIIVDDGGHTMTGQKTSFQKLFPSIRPGGYYVIEDLESSYYPSHGGGPAGSPGTTIEMLKSFLDDFQEAYHHRPLISRRRISEIHFYPNVVFIRAGE